MLQDAAVEWINGLREHEKASPEEVWYAIGQSFGFMSESAQDEISHQETQPILVRRLGEIEIRAALKRAVELRRIDGETENGGNYWRLP